MLYKFDRWYRGDNISQIVITLSWYQKGQVYIPPVGTSVDDFPYHSTWACYKFKDWRLLPGQEIEEVIEDPPNFSIEGIPAVVKSIDYL